MKTLAQWLQHQLNDSGLTQAAVSVHAGVSPATVSQMLNQDHIPRIEILFRLADCFETPREKVLRIAARMPLGDEPPPEEGHYLIEELRKSLTNGRRRPSARSRCSGAWPRCRRSASSANRRGTMTPTKTHRHNCLLELDFRRDVQRVPNRQRPSLRVWLRRYRRHCYCGSRALRSGHCRIGDEVQRSRGSRLERSLAPGGIP